MANKCKWRNFRYSLIKDISSLYMIASYFSSYLLAIASSLISLHPSPSHSLRANIFQNSAKLEAVGWQTVTRRIKITRSWSSHLDENRFRQFTRFREISARNLEKYWPAFVVVAGVLSGCNIIIVVHWQIISDRYVILVETWISCAFFESYGILCIKINNIFIYFYIILLFHNFFKKI